MSSVTSTSTPKSTATAVAPRKVQQKSARDNDAIDSDDGDDSESDDDELDPAEGRAKRIEAFCTDPIFRIRREDDYPAAMKQGGQQLVDGAWYFRFKGKQRLEFMGEMTAINGSPVSEKVVEYHQLQRKKKEFLDMAKEVDWTTIRTGKRVPKQQARRQGGNTRGKPARRGGRVK